MFYLVSPVLSEAMWATKANLSTAAISAIETAAEEWIIIEDPERLSASIARTLRGLEDHFGQRFHWCSVDNDNLRTIIYGQKHPSKCWPDWCQSFASYYGFLCDNGMDEEMKVSPYLTRRGTSWDIVGQNLSCSIANFLSPLHQSDTRDESLFKDSLMRLTKPQQANLHVLTSLTTVGIVATWLEAYSVRATIYKAWGQWLRRVERTMKE